jgi:hypothetical protein
MTRKTYRILAEELGRILAEDTTANSQTWRYIFAFCDAMKSDNSAFDKTKFVEAIHASRDATIKRWDDRALQSLTDSIVRGNG